jgi:hypothetical protein
LRVRFEGNEGWAAAGRIGICGQRHIFWYRRFLLKMFDAVCKMWCLWYWFGLLMGEFRQVNPTYTWRGCIYDVAKDLT